MSADFVMLIIGQLFTVVMIALSIVFVSIAVLKDDMKYKTRKKFLGFAVSAIECVASYWLILGVGWCICKLKTILDATIQIP